MQTSRVLIVDDEPHILAVIALKLKRAGMKPLTVRSGREALDLLRTETVDAIIADLKMPGMSGTELCARLREKPATADIPVIILSGVGHPDEAGLAVDEQIRAVVAKPFSPRELTSLVQQAASARQKRAAA